VATADTEQQLAWEARQRPRAGIAAIVGAVVSLGGEAWSLSTFRDAPSGGYLESLGKAIQPGPIGATESLRTPYYQYVDDHATAVIVSSFLTAIGYIGIAWALMFLMAAARARRPQLPRAVFYLPLIGAVLTGIGAAGFGISYVAAVRDFLDGPHTVQRSIDAGGGTVLLTSQLMWQLLGPLMLAAGWVVVALNAMRTGLLTRFMGILGIIAGVVALLRFGPLPVIQTFWLAALGALLLGYWPSGIPPAWRTGEAEPWPSQAVARREAMEARRARRGEPAPAPAAPVPDTPAESARTKRKRKRR
jgi:hypothetical protein